MLEFLNLQKIVLIAAIVSFIFAVMIIYYKTYQSIKTVRIPRVATKCPDYWDLSSDGTICINTNGINKGTLSYNECDNNGNYPCCTEGKCYIAKTSIESNQKGWASRNKFVWDGIYNG